MMARGVEALAGPTSKNMFCIADESSESSSIGVASPSVSDNDRRGGSDDEDENEAESKPNFGALGSLDSLEESLPIKRGLSKHYTGKSKSFASLSAMPSASSEDIAKTENPVNKRRRIIMAYRSPWLRRESLPSLFIPLPPTTNDEEENDEEEEEVGPMGGGDGGGRKFRVAFRSPRSFSLSDLRRA